MAMGPNPLDEPNPFAVGAPPMPMPTLPQGQTPMGNIFNLAQDAIPFLMPDFPKWLAALNLAGEGLPDWVNNPALLSVIMQNDPSKQAGPEWEAGARGDAARSLGGTVYNVVPTGGGYSLERQSDLSAAGYGLEPEVY